MADSRGREKLGRRARVPPPAGVLLLLAFATGAGAQTVKVGSFTKSTGVAPVSQAVRHGLGQTPRALILWTNGKTDESFSAGFLHGFGMTDGTTSRSAAMASQDAVSPSNASQRMADKALTVVQWGEVVLAEADLQSWDAATFTLNWTTNDASPYVIHFMAIGGPTVSAKVVDWRMPAVPGPVSVNTVGFQPDVVLHGYVGHNLVDPIPFSATRARFGLGAMDAAGHQWATQLGSSDAVATSITSRAQVTDACVYGVDDFLTVTRKASFVSMDPLGFTVDFTISSGLLGAPVISLALEGIAATAGSFLKSTTATTPAFVQFKGASLGTPVSTLPVTFNNPTASGNLVVLSVIYNPQTVTVTSVTDNKGNTYRRALGPTDWAGTSYRAYTYYAAGITGGSSHTVTVNLSGNTNNVLELYALEYSGVATVDPLDQVATRIGTGTSVACGSATNAYPSELAYGWIVTDNVPSITPTNGFVDRSGAYNNNFAGDKNVTSVAAQTFTANLSFSPPNWVCHMATFRAKGQAVSGVRFSPEAVLLASVQDVTQASPVAHNRLGLGAGDFTFNQGSSALADRDAVGTTSVQGIDKTSRAFVKVNNSTATIDAEAVVNEVNGDGFTLDWTTNDAVATEMLYLALGAPRPASYARWRSITVPTSSLGASCTASLASFPVLVSLANDQELRLTTHGGYVQSASGYDIVFTDPYGNPLDHEIEQYTSAAGGGDARGLGAGADAVGPGVDHDLHALREGGRDEPDRQPGRGVGRRLQRRVAPRRGGRGSGELFRQHGQRVQRHHPQPSGGGDGAVRGRAQLRRGERPDRPRHDRDPGPDPALHGLVVGVRRHHAGDELALQRLRPPLRRLGRQRPRLRGRRVDGVGPATRPLGGGRGRGMDRHPLHGAGPPHPVGVRHRELGRRDRPSLHQQPAGRLAGAGRAGADRAAPADRNVEDHPLELVLRRPDRRGPRVAAGALAVLDRDRVQEPELAGDVLHAGKPDRGRSRLVRGALGPVGSGAFVADGIRAGQPGLPPPPGDVGDGALDPDHAVADPRPRVFPSGGVVLLPRRGPRPGPAVPLRARGRGHEVGVDVARAGQRRVFTGG